MNQIIKKNFKGSHLSDLDPPHEFLSKDNKKYWGNPKRETVPKLDLNKAVFSRGKSKFNS